MPIEHEHKHVLRDHARAEEACVARGMERSDLQQFYLGDGCRFRRVATGPSDPMHLFTFKRDCGGRLLEVETQVSEGDYALALTQAAVVLTKTRYDMVEGEGHWSVDFLRSPCGETYFALAEVETPEGVVLPVPVFLAPHVALSVPHADNGRFANARLIDPAYAATCLRDYLASASGDGSGPTSSTSR